MSVIENPDEKEVDDIGAYLRYITIEAEPADSDEGYGFHGDIDISHNETSRDEAGNSKPDDLNGVNNE